MNLASEQNAGKVFCFKSEHEHFYCISTCFRFTKILIGSIYINFKVQTCMCIPVIESSLCLVFLHHKNAQTIKPVRNCTCFRNCTGYISCILHADVLVHLL